MSARTHTYQAELRWTGNRGTGTSSYSAYDRDHEIIANGKPVIVGSSDPYFRGDPTCWNPEELLVASVAQCHMLWYLHLASTKGIVITEYTDTPSGTMTQDSDGSGGGQFTEVVLRPVVTITDPDAIELAQHLHDDVEQFCFIARSVNFPVHYIPTTRTPAEPSQTHVFRGFGKV